MKITLVVHGFPPDLTGGVENSTLALACALFERGHEVTVIAGSMERKASLCVVKSGEDFPIYRIHRSDIYFDHWQKANHPGVGQLFEELLQRLQPDVVHVQHWIRLSNDLVLRAARLGIPSVVTLHDLWTSCLVAFRVRPDLRRFCRAPLGPDPCLDCALHVPPRPAWQSRSEGASQVASFRDNARREVELARVLVVPSRVHGEALGRWLGADEEALKGRLEVLAPARQNAPRKASAPYVPERVTPEDPLVLGSFGHWSELKGTDLLIEALSLSREPRRFRLLLAGGASAADFGERIRALAKNSSATVELLGDYDFEDLASHPVSRAALFVSGSRAHESFGLVVDEALDLGGGQLLPDLGALGERASAVPWALSYPSGDALGLARRLDELADDPAQVVVLCEAARDALHRDDRTARATEIDFHVNCMLKFYERAREAEMPTVLPVDALLESERLAEIEAWDQAISNSDPKETGLQ